MPIEWDLAPLERLFGKLPEPTMGPDGLQMNRADYLRSRARSGVLELCTEQSLGRQFTGALTVEGDLTLDAPLTWVRGELEVRGNILSPDRNVLYVEGDVRARNALLSRAILTGTMTTEGLVLAHSVAARTIAARFLLLGPDEEPDLEKKTKAPLITLGKKTKKPVPAEWLDQHGKVDRFLVGDFVKAGKLPD